MSTTRTRKMTDEHQQESARLRALWDKREDRMSQQAFGEAYNIGIQSAVSHFLQGQMPISLKAAIGFSTGLHCRIEDFSPRLAKLATAYAFAGGDASMSNPHQAHQFLDPHELLTYMEHVKARDDKPAMFDEFMARPAIKKLIDLLPPDDPHDVLISLIKAAFVHAFDQGASAIVIEMLSASFGKTETTK